MNPYVRDRINRKLDTLSDERLYQVLDYVEFLESKYAEKPAPVTNVLSTAKTVADQIGAPPPGTPPATPPSAPPSASQATPPTTDPDAPTQPPAA
jgi:hypothetical protein